MELSASIPGGRGQGAQITSALQWSELMPVAVCRVSLSTGAFTASSNSCCPIVQAAGRGSALQVLASEVVHSVQVSQAPQLQELGALLMKAYLARLTNKDAGDASQDNQVIVFKSLEPSRVDMQCLDVLSMAQRERSCCPRWLPGCDTRPSQRMSGGPCTTKLLH